MGAQYFEGPFSALTSQACVVDVSTPVFSGIASVTPNNDGSFTLTWATATSSKTPVRYELYAALGIVSAASLFVTANRIAFAPGLVTSWKVFVLRDQVTYFLNGQTYTFGIRAVDSQNFTDSNVVVLNSTAIASGNIGGLFQATEVLLAADHVNLNNDHINFQADHVNFQADHTNFVADLATFASDLATLASYLVTMATNNTNAAANNTTMAGYLATFASLLTSLVSEIAALHSENIDFALNNSDLASQLTTLSGYLTTLAADIANLAATDSSLSASAASIASSAAAISGLISGGVLIGVIDEGETLTGEIDG